MAEEEKPAVEPDRNYDSMRIAKTIEEGKAEAQESQVVRPTAESLGVDSASFEKYYHQDTNEFDWASYGKEQAFKAAQKQTKDETSTTEQESKTKSNAPKHSTSDEGDSDAKEAVEQAGLDWDSLGEKISAKGDLDDGDYEALRNIGIPDQVVKSYVTMVKNEAQNLIDDVIERAGGQDSFNKVYDALEGKPIELRQKIDSLLADPETREYGVDMMFQQAAIERPNVPAKAPQGTVLPEHMKEETPRPRNRTGGSASVKGFESFEEQVQAQRDPRYRTDLNYRNEVLRRIEASTYSINPRTHTGGL